MIHLVNLTTRGENGTRDRSSWTDALIGKFSEVGWEAGKFIWSYDRLMESHIARSRRDYFTKENDLGCWVYKPYILLDSMTRINEGDVLVWLDSDLAITSMEQMKGYVKLAQENKALFFELIHPQHQFTAPECFEFMGMTEDKYRQAKQLWAAIHLWVKTPEIERFLLKWYTYCLNPDILGDFSKYKHHRHRWDQSILTNLVTHYGFKTIDNNGAQVVMHPPF